MVLYPDVYAKAQAEIDRVVGNERLPVHGDRHALPYLECVLREVYRYVLRRVAINLRPIFAMKDGTPSHP